VGGSGKGDEVAKGLKSSELRTQNSNSETQSSELKIRAQNSTSKLREFTAQNCGIAGLQACRVEAENSELKFKVKGTTQLSSEL
jgi:hypothetical protein